MDAISDFLIQYGSLGMFISAVLAGSVLPFSSEVVMAALQKAGTNPVQLIIWGTIGNLLGSMINYYIGHLGKMEWIEKYLHVKRDKLERAERFTQRYGAWMGLLAWVPILGSAITVALGYLRVNPYLSVLAMVVGKLLRYVALVYAVAQV